MGRVARMTNTCTCKAEHWQPHADSCPLANKTSGTLPRIPPKQAGGFVGKGARRP